MQYIAIGLVALLASFVQASTGLGYALICMALWPLMVPFRTAAVMEVISAFLMFATITLRYRKHVNLRLIAWPLVSTLVCNTLGVMLLVTSAESLLRRIMGIALIALAIYFMVFSNRIHVQPTRRNGLLAGAIGGLLGGMLGIGGPPMAAYMLAVTDDKMEYNATLQFYFLATSVYVFLVHIFAGSIDAQVLRYGSAAAVGMLGGTALGMLVFKRLSMQNIKKLIYPFFIVMGIYFILKG